MWPKSPKPSCFKGIRWLKIIVCLQFTYTIKFIVVFSIKIFRLNFNIFFLVFKFLKIWPVCLWKLRHGSTRTPSWLYEKIPQSSPASLWITPSFHHLLTQWWLETYLSSSSPRQWLCDDVWRRMTAYGRQGNVLSGIISANQEAVIEVWVHVMFGPGGVNNDRF